MYPGNYATQNPDRAAIIMASTGQRVSYVEFEAQANQLAHYLQKMGVGPETMVAMYMERSTEMIVGILGILKAGGVYVPLDPSYPHDRLRYIARDSGLRALVAQQSVVVLTLIGPPGPDPTQCPPLDKCSGGIVGAEIALRIDAFSKMFTYGFVGRVCESSYDAFFMEAVSVIKSACDEFVPPG